MMHEKYKVVILNLSKSLFCFIWAVTFGVKRNERADKCYDEGHAASEFITWVSTIGIIVFTCIVLPYQLICLKKLDSQPDASQGAQALQRKCFSKATYQTLSSCAEGLFVGIIIANILASAFGLNATHSDTCNSFEDGKYFAYIFISLALLVVLVLLLYLRRKDMAASAAEQHLPTTQADRTQEEAVHMKRVETVTGSPNTDRLVRSPQLNVMSTNAKTEGMHKSSSNFNFKNTEDMLFEKTVEDEGTYPKKDYKDIADLPDVLLHQNEHENEEGHGNEDENGHGDGEDIYIEMGSIEETKGRQSTPTPSENADKSNLKENKDDANIIQDHSPPLQLKIEGLDSDHQSALEEKSRESVMEKLKFKETIDKKTELMAEMIFRLRTEDKLGRRSPIHDIFGSKKDKSPQNITSIEQAKEAESKTDASQRNGRGIIRREGRKRSGSFPVVLQQKARAVTPQDRVHEDPDQELENPWGNPEKRERNNKQKKHVTFGMDSIAPLSKNASTGKPHFGRNKSSNE